MGRRLIRRDMPVLGLEALLFVFPIQYREPHVDHRFFVFPIQYREPHVDHSFFLFASRIVGPMWTTQSVFCCKIIQINYN